MGQGILPAESYYGGYPRGGNTLVDIAMQGERLRDFRQRKGGLMDATGASTPREMYRKQAERDLFSQDMNALAEVEKAVNQHISVYGTEGVNELSAHLWKTVPAMRRFYAKPPTYGEAQDVVFEDFVSGANVSLPGGPNGEMFEFKKNRRYRAATNKRTGKPMGITEQPVRAGDVTPTVPVSVAGQTVELPASTVYKEETARTGGALKVGITKESILWKRAQGKELSKAEKKVLREITQVDKAIFDAAVGIAKTNERFKRLKSQDEQLAYIEELVSGMKEKFFPGNEDTPGASPASEPSKGGMGAELSEDGKTVTVNGQTYQVSEDGTVVIDGKEYRITK